MSKSKQQYKNNCVQLSQHRNIRAINRKLIKRHCFRVPDTGIVKFFNGKKFHIDPALKSDYDYRQTADKLGKYYIHKNKVGDAIQEEFLVVVYYTGETFVSDKVEHLVPALRDAGYAESTYFSPSKVSCM